MMWETLQQQQPIFSRIFKHQLEREQRSHAYLLVGNHLTREAALFMAASFNCERGLIACEQCDHCRRVFAHQFADIIELDGSGTSIKKEDVLKIQRQFSTSALEKNAQKVYILNGVDQATKESMNALLKFLEEPEGQSTIGILIASSLDNVMETIQSRCQIFRFEQANPEKLQQLAETEGVDHEEAFFLARLYPDLSQMMDHAEDPQFKNVIGSLKEIAGELFRKPAVGMIYLQNFVSRKSGNGYLEFKLFLDVFILMLEELVNTQNGVFDSLSTALIEKNQKHFLHYLFVSITIRDRLTKSVNLPLLVDQMCYMLGRTTDES